MEDGVFSKKMVGDGVAIIPKDGLVVAPCDGKEEIIKEYGIAKAKSSRVMSVKINNT